MMFSRRSFLLKRRSAFSTVSPSCSVTSAKLHPPSHSILPIASCGLFRHGGSRLCLSQLLRQFLAGLEACIPFCGDGDGLPCARVASLALLPLSYHEAAKPA